MISVAHALIGLTVVFFLLLGIKKWRSWSFCVICVSSTLTWVAISVLYILDLFDSLALIILMAGMTLHGLYQLWEERTGRRFLVFRLPVLLTGLALVYQIFVFRIYLDLLIFLAVLWLFFLFLFFYRENEWFGGFVDEVIECCKDW